MVVSRRSVDSQHDSQHDSQPLGEEEDAVVNEKSSLITNKLDAAAPEQEGLADHVQGLSFLNCCFCVVGMTVSSSAAALAYMVKNDLQASPEEATQYFSTTGLAVFFPFCVKPCYGFLLDNLPILGQRRVPYVVISLVGMVLAAGSTTQVYSTDGLVFWTLFLNMCLALCLSATEALVVDYTIEQRMTEAETGSCLANVWFWFSVGMSIGAGVGGCGVSMYDARKVFGLAAVPAVGMLVVMANGFSPEEPKALRGTGEEIGIREALSEFGQTLKVTVDSKDVSKMLAFVVCFFICPSIAINLTGGAFYYFSSASGLGIPIDILAFVPFVMNISWTVGIYCYERYFSRIALRAYLQVMVPLAAVVQLSGALLFMGWLERVPMQGKVAALMTWAIGQSFLQGLTQTPFFTMISVICTPITAGTVMAMVTSIMNASLMSSTQICASMQMAYGITSTHFDGLAMIAVLCAVIRLIPVFAINVLLPEDFSSMQRGLQARIAAYAALRGAQSGYVKVGKEEVVPSDMMEGDLEGGEQVV